MGAIYPRRQAARLGALISKQFVPGLILIDSPPRQGKSDLLRQVFGFLLKQRTVAPVLLDLDGGRLANGAAERTAAQLVAHKEGLLRSPHALLDRAAILDREDYATWEAFLTMCGDAPAPERFCTALARLAESTGPVCLLLDHASDHWLRAAAAISSHLVVVAAGNSADATPAGQVVELDPFTVRDGVLMAETLSRALGVEFIGSAAERFVAYCASDPFVLEAIVRSAAASGTPLDTADSYARLYVAELMHGTLAACFQRHVPGKPASAERQFAVEVLASGGPDAALLQRWRHRVAFDNLIEKIHRDVPTVWTAARDWAELQHGALAGPFLLRLLAGMESASRAHSADQISSRICAGLKALKPTAAQWLAGNGVAGAKVPEIAHVATEPIAGADLFLCYGFAEGRCHADSAAVLAVAIIHEPLQLSQTAAALNARTMAALPWPADAPPHQEKWIVVKEPGLDDLEIAQRTGTRLIDRDLFNRLLTEHPTRIGVGAGAPIDATSPAIVLRLPMAADYEVAAVRVLDHLAERFNWDKRVAAQARIALVEACLNAVEHGRAAKLDPAASFMEIRLDATEERLEMVVTNPGPPFQPDEETAGSALHRGHGLKIIRSLMDSVTFSSDLNGTSIRMVKRLDVAAPPGSPSHAGFACDGVRPTPDAALAAAEKPEHEKTAPRVKRS